MRITWSDARSDIIFTQNDESLEQPIQLMVSRVKQDWKWHVPIPGATLVTSENKNLSHKKYSSRTLKSLYWSSVQSTQIQNTSYWLKEQNTIDAILFPRAWVLWTNRRVIDIIIITAKTIIESSIVLYILCDLIARGGGVWSARITHRSIDWSASISADWWMINWTDRRFAAVLFAVACCWCPRSADRSGF